MLTTPAVGWSEDRLSLRILDQRALPQDERVLELRDLADIIDAIRTLAVRGAPAIGVAAAIGLPVALATRLRRREEASVDGASNDQGTSYSVGDVVALARELADGLIAARPTAVNLAWAVERVMRVALASAGAGDHESSPHGSAEALLAVMRAEAECIRLEDVAMCDAIGTHGMALIPDGARVLTHCNAGALATSGIGTALAPVYAAHRAGRRVTVYADETRPLRQGARLTAWELARAGIPVTVLPDGAAASLIASGKVDLVIVGADRIAANGDVANKIGTYGVALAAHAHGVPFYVAAPGSTFDVATPDGASMTIEHRDASELAPLPDGVAVYNPAFDITPARLITAYVTDSGVHSHLPR